MKKTLYVDLDGTCFEFKRHESLDPLLKRGYFTNILPFSQVIQGIKEYRVAHPEVIIKTLSCCLDAAHIIEDKNTLMDKYMPFIPKEDRIFIPYGESKAQYSTTQSYILDDYTPNLLEFEEFGGVGIKLINNINWNTKSWKGKIINFEYPSWMIVDILEKIINKEEIS